MDTIIEEVDDYCPSDCIYRLRFDNVSTCCGYCIVENQPRGCKVSECNRYKRGKRRVTIEKGTLEFRWEVDEED